MDSTVYSRPRHTNLAGRPSFSCIWAGSGRIALIRLRSHVQAAAPWVLTATLATSGKTGSYQHLPSFEHIFG
jgi:hypothetical protein